MININFRADFVDCYASIVLDQFPNSIDVCWRYTCLTRHGRDVFWTYRRPLENVTQTLGFSIMFHPQTVVAIYAKFQWVLCPQWLKLNNYNLCVERRYYCLAHCIIDRRNDKQSVTWSGVNVFKTRLFELPRRPIWISDIVQVCIL